MEKHYHIDVTPEEDALFRDAVVYKNNSPMSRLLTNSTFWVVVGIHMLILSAVTLTASSTKKYEPEMTAREITEDMSGSLIQPLAKCTKSEPVRSQKTQRMQTYIVQKGDTLYSISRKCKVSCKQLIKTNKIKTPDKIFVGQTIKIL
jgi:nucleoid-associated protein YgaU